MANPQSAQRPAAPIQNDNAIAARVDVRARLVDLLGRHPIATAQALRTRLSTSLIAASFDLIRNCGMR
jgi:hypothetical protein